MMGDTHCLVSYLLRQKNESAHVGCCQPASCCPKSLAIGSLKTEPISRLAAQHQVSRKFPLPGAKPMRHWMLPSVPPWSGGALLPAHHQDLVISIDFGINPRLPLFVPRRRGTVAGFVRPANWCRNDSQPATVSC